MNESEILKQASNKKKKKRLGRGNASGKGTYCGRGVKGQKARKGKKLRPGFEGGQTPLVQRMPKLKGFKSLKDNFQVINVADLEIFANGTKVDEKLLAEKGLIKPKKPVKLLGDGEISKKLTINIAAISNSAKSKIEKAGGKIEESQQQNVSKQTQKKSKK